MSSRRRVEGRRNRCAGVTTLLPIFLAALQPRTSALTIGPLALPVVQNGSINITWRTQAGDPSQFSIRLSNKGPEKSSHTDTLISDVKSAALSLPVTLPNGQYGPNYVLEFMNGSSTNTIYATSELFNIDRFANVTSSKSSSSVGSLSLSSLGPSQTQSTDVPAAATPHQSTNIVAVAVGILIPVFALFTAIPFFFWWRRKRTNTTTIMFHQSSRTSGGGGGGTSKSSGGRSRSGTTSRRDGRDDEPSLPSLFRPELFSQPSQRRQNYDRFNAGQGRLRFQQVPVPAAMGAYEDAVTPATAQMPMQSLIHTSNIRDPKGHDTLNLDTNDDDFLVMYDPPGTGSPAAAAGHNSLAYLREEQEHGFGTVEEARSEESSSYVWGLPTRTPSPQIESLGTAGATVGSYVPPYGITSEPLPSARHFNAPGLSRDPSSSSQIRDEKIRLDRAESRSTSPPTVPPIPTIFRPLPVPGSSSRALPVAPPSPSADGGLTVPRSTSRSNSSSAVARVRPRLPSPPPPSVPPASSPQPPETALKSGGSVPSRTALMQKIADTQTRLAMLREQEHQLSMASTSSPPPSDDNHPPPPARVESTRGPRPLPIPGQPSSPNQTTRFASGTEIAQLRAEVVRLQDELRESQVLMALAPPPEYDTAVGGGLSAPGPNSNNRLVTGNSDMSIPTSAAPKLPRPLPSRPGAAGP